MASDAISLRDSFAGGGEETVKEAGEGAGSDIEQSEVLEARQVKIANKDFGGVRVAGWQIQTRKRYILDMAEVNRWEKVLETNHLPEMVFGNSCLELLHEKSGTKIHFNALDALRAWKQENLPPVEVPAAAKWKLRSKPGQWTLNYDYTFTTPYCGSETIEEPALSGSAGEGDGEATLTQGSKVLEWVPCEEQINMVALQAKDPILFYDEVVLYEDELADNGISFLSVKVRVMPTCWFLLLRFWLRVDGSIMRLRDTRIFSAFEKDPEKLPLVIREYIGREETFQSLASRGLRSESSAYADPSTVADKLSIVSQRNEKLVLTTPASQQVSS